MGHVFLGHKEDGGAEFSQADEETLVMFAAQAALVIANARTHREERRARADLETLIDTSPVGVVVLDAQTGGMASVNREALRIVDGLRDEGQTPEGPAGGGHLCALATEGRFSLRELSHGGGCSVPGETVRAEEIALQGPRRAQRLAPCSTPRRSTPRTGSWRPSW